MKMPRGRGKTKQNTLLFCPLCGKIWPEKQIINQIDTEHIILNCGACSGKSLIVRFDRI